MSDSITITTISAIDDASGRLAAVAILPSRGRSFRELVIDEDGARDLVAKLTAWLDAPRLAARETPEVVAHGDPLACTALVRTPFEWGVAVIADGTALAPGDEIEWFANEGTARTDYAESRGKALCICGAECDEDEIDRSGDEPQCPTCVAEAVAAFKSLRLDCRRCGADLLGADLSTRADSDPNSPWQCPRCHHFAVEEIDAMPEATP